MNRLSDCIGKTFNRLTLLGLHEKRGRKNFGLFLCSCGKQHVAEFSAVACGGIKSCGCLLLEASRRQGKANATHGMSKSPEFNIWTRMTQRCQNPRDKSYGRYGGRGIKVCQRWLKFENFYEDMGPRPGREFSLDRIDVNGDYCPENCRWATAKEQASNTRRNVYVNVDGEAKTLSDAAIHYGVDRCTVKSRMARGMDVNDALTAPVREISKTRRNEPIEFEGVTDNAAGWAERTGIPYKTLLYRLNAGWDIHRALTAEVRKW